MLDKKCVSIYRINDEFRFSCYGNDEHSKTKHKIKSRYVEYDTTIEEESLRMTRDALEEKVNEAITNLALVEEYLKLIKYSEQYKQAVKRIDEYIDNLKTDGKLNTWYKDKENSNKEYIENGTYKMSISVYERKYYKAGVTRYEVSYNLYHNTILPYSDSVQSIKNKVFTGKNEADRYIKGRKKYYADYFKEERPPISNRHAQCVKVNGIILKGYTVKGVKEDGESA